MTARGTKGVARNTLDGIGDIRVQVWRIENGKHVRGNIVRSWLFKHTTVSKVARRVEVALKEMGLLA